MPDIKTRDIAKVTIKTIDKSAVAAERMKSAFIQTCLLYTSFLLIMTVYGRFFKLYMDTALAPIPLSTFAGEPSQNVGKSFIKSY